MNRFKYFPALLGLTVGLVSPCLGQQSSLTPITPPQQQIKWIVGPSSASLGNLVDVAIPEGYRLADAEGARALLRQMRNPVPPGLVGILAPDSGAWWVVLEFADIGYVKTSAEERIDASGILSVLQHKMEIQNTERVKRGLPPLKSINWERAPEFDSTDHSLEFAYQIESQSDKAVKQAMQLMGRKGVLAASAVRAAQSGSEMVPLKELMKNVTFKTGEGYADFEVGDKVATMTVAQLITGEEQSGTLREKGWFKKWWDELTPTQKKIFGGLAFCVVAAVVAFLVTREIRSLKLHESFPTRSARGATNGKQQRVGRSGRVHSSQRKRAFDYQKFYSDMMTQVSSRSYSGVGQRQREATLENSNEVVASAPEHTGSPGEKSITSEFIAQQKDFIEEQRRLMHQQAKLIEERSKLIEEKNQLLAKQSEMIDNHLL